MRILELIPNLASGGAERFVTDLSNELVLDGNDVSIFTFRSAHNLNFYILCQIFKIMILAVRG